MRGAGAGSFVLSEVPCGWSPGTSGHSIPLCPRGRASFPLQPDPAPDKPAKTSQRKRKVNPVNKDVILISFYHPCDCYMVVYRGLCAAMRSQTTQDRETGGPSMG